MSLLECCRKFKFIKSYNIYNRNILVKIYKNQIKWKNVILKELNIVVATLKFFPCDFFKITFLCYEQCFIKIYLFSIFAFLLDEIYEKYEIGMKNNLVYILSSFLNAKPMYKLSVHIRYIPAHFQSIFASGLCLY